MQLLKTIPAFNSIFTFLLIFDAVCVLNSDTKNVF